MKMRQIERRVLITVGQINVAWDEIDFVLWYIFDVLLNVHWSYSYSIYFSHQNSRNRREMLASLAKIALPDKPNQLKILNKLLDRVQKAASKRNDVTHGVWSTERQGRRILIRRIPLKRDISKLEGNAIRAQELEEIHKQLVSVYQDILIYIGDRWHTKNAAQLKNTRDRDHGFSSALWATPAKSKGKRLVS
jgi:hypothetical protein